jgi:hypothetical protein
MNKIMLGISTVLFGILFTFTPAFAASTVVVYPGNTQGWTTGDTRTGGTVDFVNDATSPYPTGALQLTTDATNAAKAQYVHTAANVPLSSVTDLSYYTKQVSGPAVADPSYQIAVYLNGTAESYTNLVYEPYWNGTVTPSVWQNWNVAQGQYWSSKTFTDGTCSVTNGAGGPPFYTLAQLQTMCPDAVVVGFGVNVGTYNPNYVVETDGVNFNGTVYDFEASAPLIGPPTNKDECKNGGWMTFNNPTFPNQGQCVSYTNHH